MNRYAVPLYTERESVLTAAITGITGSGSIVTVTARNNFSAGQSVTISGSYCLTTPEAFNITGAIASATPTQFTISSSVTGNYQSGGVATVTEAYWTRAQYDSYIDSLYGNNDTLGSQAMLKTLYPITSCLEANRPTAGRVVKPVFTNMGAKAGDYAAKWRSMADWDSFNSWSTNYNSSGDYFTLDRREYFASSDQPYKYYMAGYTSAGAPITSAYVQYKDAVWANKIDIVFENSVAKPRTYSVDLRIGGSWVTIYSVTTTDFTASNGRLTLWNTNNNRVSSPNGTWGLTAPTTTPVSSSGVDYCRAITGIRVNVTALSFSSTGNFCIIKMAPVVNLDLTAYLASWSTDEDLSDSDAIAPVGTVTSNTGNVEFDNSGVESDGLYTFESRRVMGSAPFIGEFVRKYANITIDLTYNSETIRQMTMSVDSWSVSDGDTASASCVDDATDLQATSCPNVAFTNVSPLQAVWRLLDLVGFTEIRIRHIPGVRLPVIDWFYVDDTQTVWDAVKQICYSHQCAVWVDASGIINIASKEWLYGGTRSSVWNLGATGSGGVLPDIESHEETTTEPVNVVTVQYTPIREYRATDPGSGATPKNNTIGVTRIQTQTLFTPSDPILLGAAELMETLSASAKTMKINPNSLNASAWGAFSGHFMIDQEIIKFDGLRFKYQDRDNPSLTRYEIVKNSEGLQELFLKALGRVLFTGQVMNLERGKFGTKAVAHNRWQNDWSYPSSNAKCVFQSTQVDPPGVTICDSRTSVSSTTYFGMFKNLSAMPGGTGAVFTATNINRVTVKLTLGQMKTTTKTVNGETKTTTYIANDYGAGVVVNAVRNGSNVITDGYYVEVRSSAKQADEIAILQIKNGVILRGDGKYFNYAIAPGKDVDLSIAIDRSRATNIYVRVTVNGHFVGERAFARSSYSSAPNYNIGLMTSGPTYATFSWLSATNDKGTAETFHEQFVGHIKQLATSVFNYRRLPRAVTGFYYEQFDNLVRQMYVEDVKFAKMPAVDVQWFPIVNDVTTNKSTKGIWIARTYDVAAAMGNITSSGAQIVVANIAARRSVVLSEDGGTNYPMIFGRVIERAGSPITVTATNQYSKFSYGEKKLEINPTWITNRSAAENVANWVLGFSGDGINTHNVKIFSNHLLEIGDVVTMTYNKKGVPTTAKFVVAAKSLSWSDGLETDVRLVRIV